MCERSDALQAPLGASGPASGWVMPVRPRRERSQGLAEPRLDAVRRGRKPSRTCRHSPPPAAPRRIAAPPPHRVAESPNLIYAHDMNEQPSPQWTTRLLGGFALLVLALAVGFAVRGALHPPGKRPPVIIEEPAGDEDPLARAERLAAVDSSQKTTWVDEIPDLDVSMLTPAQQGLFIRFANAQSCTCGCGFTLAACRRYDSLCDVSLPRVERLRDSVAAGFLTRAEGLRERPVSVTP